MSDPHRRDDDCEVTECACGHFTVRVGRVCVEMTRDELMRLRQTLTDAAMRLQMMAARLAPTSERSH